MSFFTGQNQIAGRPHSAIQYRVDLNRLMDIYASNYLLFCKIFPVALEVGEQVQMRSDIDSSTSGFQQLLLECREQTRYTSLFEIRQDIKTNLPKSIVPHMLVRLYHDARLAEVCSSQQISRIKPRYDYPNDKMHHKDEKQQVNLFLHDWLKFCLQHRVA